VGIPTGVMSDRGKMNLEELRKTFPALDDLSKEKLLGGGGGGLGDYWDPYWNSDGVPGSQDFVRMPQATPMILF